MRKFQLRKRKRSEVLFEYLLCSPNSLLGPKIVLTTSEGQMCYYDRDGPSAGINFLRVT